MSGKFSTLIISGLILLSCSSKTPKDITAPSIIPEPVQMQLKNGDDSFKLDRNTVIVSDTSQSDARNVAIQLKNEIDSATGFDISIKPKNSRNGNYISLSVEGGTIENDEGYQLDVFEDDIAISAPSATGLFYGVQTLKQLLPPEVYQSDYSLVPANTTWRVTAVSIMDYPRFEYRGMHLDVSRHFFPIEFIKRYLDLMAMHKMNRFHWHLTDDQGWRIEIEQYPLLTEIGGWRDSTLVGHYGTGIYDGERYGGYYTQKKIREVVEYARKKHITIIPEIEMPGHASAALAAYPELGCVEGKKYLVKTTWGVFDDVFCPKEETFTFLQNVLTEVMDLFPGKYIHIGGDEAPKKQWESSKLAQQVMDREKLETEEELQSYFIQRIERFLNDNGRQIIGWDEILEGGLAPNATVMSWRGTKGGIKAAEQGHNVIMTPVSHLYLDYYQADKQSEPLAIGGFSPLEEVYHFEPVPKSLSNIEAQYILGAQGKVWTEYMHSGDKVEYMAYPRASAVAEITWSPKEKRNWTDFWRRLQTHFKRYEVMDVNAATHYKGKMPHLLR